MYVSIWCIVTTATFLLTISGFATAHQASDYFNVCSIKDPNLNNCIKDAMNAFRPKLVAGLPELGLPPYDPMHIKKMEFKGTFALISFNQILTDIVGTGHGDFTIDEVLFNPETLTLDFKESVPFINATAKYQHEGALSFMAKEGIVNYLVRGVKKDVHVQLEIQKHNEKFILQVIDWKWNWNIEDGSVHFSNLDFSKPGMFGSIAEKLQGLTKNFKMGFKLFKYLPEREFAIYFKDMTNALLMNFEVKELLLQ